MEKYKFYVDLDGVLTDLYKSFKDLTGIDLYKHDIKDKDFWPPVNEAGYEFWVNIPWMVDGKELWDYVKKYEPELLSAPYRQNDSRIGKHDWVKRELPGVHLILRSAGNKKEFASPNSILIDDRISNIDDWNKAGGIGILHTSTKNTIDELKNLGL